MPKTFVSILIPTLNEERYIERAIETVSPKSGDLDYELLVLDGGSTDSTIQIVERLAIKDRRIRLVQNRKRLQSAAMNIGADLADPRADVIVRADCHAIYPADFVARAVQSLRASGAVSVVVPMQTVGLSCFQRGVAIAQNSVLGNGGSLHRKGGMSRFVEHGHHAAFDRSYFRQIGGYDETFSHNEDAELDCRIQKQGGKLWFDGDLPISYFPRESFISLARQYFSHGKGRARTVFKHRQPVKPRQLAPVAILLGSVCCLLAAPMLPIALALPALYLMAAMTIGARLAISHRTLCGVLSGPAAIVMHMGWATGFLVMTTKQLLGRAFRDRHDRDRGLEAKEV